MYILRAAWLCLWHFEFHIFRQVDLTQIMLSIQGDSECLSSKLSACPCSAAPSCHPCIMCEPHTRAWRRQGEGPLKGMHDKRERWDLLLRLGPEHAAS